MCLSILVECICADFPPRGQGGAYPDRITDRQRDLTREIFNRVYQATSSLQNHNIIHHETESERFSYFSVSARFQGQPFSRECRELYVNSDGEFAGTIRRDSDFKLLDLETDTLFTYRLITRQDHWDQVYPGIRFISEYEWVPNNQPFFD